MRQKKNGYRTKPGHIVFWLLAVSLLLCGCKQQEQIPELKEPAKLIPDIETVEYRDLYNMTVEEGCIRFSSQVVKAPGAGAVETLYVFAGQTVEKDQILLKLDTETAEKELEELTQQLEYLRLTARYGNSTLRLTAQTCQKELDRMRQAGADQIEISLKEIDNWEAWQNLRHAEQLQQLQQEKIQVRIDEISRWLENGAVIKAPAAGRIDWVRDGIRKEARVTEEEAIFCISDPEQMYIVSNRISSKILNNCSSICAIVGDGEYALVPLENNQAEDVRNSVSGIPLKSRFELENQAEPVRQTQKNALIKCVWNFRPHVLAVPGSAVFRDGADCYVYQMVNGVSKKTPVEIGQATDFYVEIKSGLKEGDSIYVEG